MDRGVSDYLYTVAVVAVTFVGFSTVFVTFREALGGTMSKYDVLLIHNILYLGVTAIVGCLLPPLLALLGAGPDLTVRVSSLTIAVPMLVFNVLYPRSRHAATGRSMPKRVWVDLGLVYTAAALLVANAAGVIATPSLAVHALGVTVLLVAIFLAFLFGLDLLPSEPAKPVESESTRESAGSPGRARRRASRR